MILTECLQSNKEKEDRIRPVAAQDKLQLMKLPVPDLCILRNSTPGSNPFQINTIKEANKNNQAMIREISNSAPTTAIPSIAGDYK